MSIKEEKKTRVDEIADSSTETLRIKNIYIQTEGGGSEGQTICKFVLFHGMNSEMSRWMWAHEINKHDQWLL